MPRRYTKVVKFFVCCLILVMLSSGVCWGLEKSTQFIYDSHGHRDPFVPISSKSSTEVVKDGKKDMSFSLEGIIWEPGGKALAIINDTILREHDQIDGFEVNRIMRDRVVLSKDDKEVSLFLSKEEAEKDGE